MPHWSCHYYRLETDSSFVVGSWRFSEFDSIVSLVVYSALIVFNLIALSSRRFRVSAAVTSGLCHLLICGVHVVRLVHPFHFEVFDHSWSIGASIRESAIVGGFGILCLVVAARMRRLEA